MKKFKQHIIRFVTLLVALQLLNLSIYAQNFKPIFVDTSSEQVNITETFTEFIVEVVLGHKNAIPEQKQHHNFHKHISFKAISLSTPYRLPELRQHSSICAVPIKESYCSLYLSEINPPPPKA